MKLRFKTIGAVSLTLALLISGLYIYTVFSLEAGFSRVENRDAMLNADRVIDAVEAELQNIEDKMKDWAAWDDTYQYIEDHNKEYEVSNLVSSTLYDITLNLIVFIDAQGEFVFSRKIDLINQKDYPVPQEILDFIKNNPSLLHGPQDVAFRRGILVFSDGPLLFSSQPIRNSGKTGPNKGTLFYGRNFDSAMLEKFKKITHLNLEMHLHREEGKTPDIVQVKDLLKDNKQVFLRTLSEDRIAGYVLFKDYFDNPALIMRMDTPREVMAMGKKTIFSMLLCIVLVGLALMGVIIFILDKSVLSRLLNLNRQIESIGKQGDLGLRVKMDGKDELRDLSNEMNRMLTTLEQNKNSIRLLLDNVDQGFLSFDKTGTVGNECSRTVSNLFSINPVNAHISQLFREPREKWDKFIPIFFEAAMPFEDLVPMLPSGLELDEKIIELKYFPVYGKSGDLTYILVVATDTTQLVALRRKNEQEQQTHKALIRILESKNGFIELLKMVDNLSKFKSINPDFKRALHTIKAGLAFYECRELAQLSHQMEDRVAGDVTITLEEVIRPIQRETQKFVDTHDHILHIKAMAEKHVSIPVSSLEDLMRKTMLHKEKIPSALLEAIVGMRDLPIQENFDWLNQTFLQTAKNLGKEVLPIQWLPSVPICGDDYTELFQSLIHIVRNCADHGIEPGEERVALGKPRKGQVTFELTLKNGFYHLMVSDDGRGANPDLIASKAKDMGLPLPNGSEGHLEILFYPGFSTSKKVTETSGRGVGLDVVRQEARKIGGDVQVHNSPGKGMSVEIIFPKRNFLAPGESQRALAA